MFPAQIYDLARQVVTQFTQKKLRVVTAESCTGGLIAAALTQIPGSSAVMERGFIAYSNDSKTELLGIMPDDLDQFGAVSRETAEAMAKGALEFSRADAALSVTGIAGPDGGSLNKPVGLVYFGVTTREGALFNYECRFSGDRDDIRRQAVQEGLRLLLSLAEE